MRYVSACIRPVGTCYQLTVDHWYGLLSGTWPTVTTHTTLDEAVTALIVSRCGADISFETGAGQRTGSYLEYLELLRVASMLPANLRGAAAVQADGSPEPRNCLPQVCPAQVAGAPLAQPVACMSRPIVSASNNITVVEVRKEA